MEIATILGLVGVVANALWPLTKKRTTLLIGQIVAALFMGLHFYLLEAFTGATVMLVAAVQATLAIPLEKHSSFKLVYLASLCITPFICWYTWQGFPSMFSTFALACFCIGNYNLNTTVLRSFLLLCIVGWVCHNLIVGSYPGLISNFIALCTSIYGLIREHTYNKSKHRTRYRSLGV